MPPKKTKVRRRRKSGQIRSMSEQRVVIKFSTYALAGTAETDIVTAALSWTLVESSTSSIGVWSTYRVMSVQITAVPGMSVRWRVTTSSTKPTIDYAELLSHPDTVTSMNTTPTPVSRTYSPSLSPYTLDQNWVTPAHFTSGMHVTWAGGTGLKTGATVVLIIQFVVSLNNWMGKSKPLTEQQGETDAAVGDSSWSLLSRESYV